jgi:hypothetical protein
MAAISMGGMTFQSKEKLINYIRFVLNNQELHEPLEGKWFNVINDVLKGHYNYKAKVGTGSYQISVTQCPVNPNNRHFYVIRQDGSSTDFSFYKALAKRSHASEVKKALRDAVVDQSISYKKNYFKDNAVGNYCICPVTGLKITVKSSHLDHYPLQFDEIVSDWLKLNNLKIADIEVKPSYDNKILSEIKDEDLIKNFYDYHLQVAKYRVVLSQVNLQRKKAKGLEF